MESVLDCGLVRGHAYGITAVKKVRLGDRLVQKEGVARLFMLRMRNPWGTADWTGAWSQGLGTFVGLERKPRCQIVNVCFTAPRRSQEWQQMSRADREKAGLVVRDVGEFWYDFSCCYRVCLVAVLMAVPFPQDGLPGFLPLFHGRGGVSPRGEVPPVAQLSLAGGAPLWGVGLSSIIPRRKSG